jgi:hypothetical protein
MLNVRNRPGIVGLMVAALAAPLVLSSAALAKHGGGGGNSGSGKGGGGGSARIRRDYRLVATEEGDDAGIKGNARIEARPAKRNREKVKVEVESSVLEEGTLLSLWVLNPSQSADPIFLGEVTLTADADGDDDGDDDSAVRGIVSQRRDGDDDDDDGDDDDDTAEVRAELELSTEHGGSLPTGVSPVTKITGFLVTDSVTGELLATSVLRRDRSR